MVVEHYDGSGTLLSTAETREVGDGWAQQLADGRPAGSRLRLEAGDGPLVEIGGIPSAGIGEARYQIGDRQGSVSVELDHAGAVTSFEAFFPHGGSAVVAGPAMPAVASKVFRYTGQPADDSTGLYSFPARYQAPWLGRFLEPDPSGALDGLNLYAFTRGNPTTFVDPTGRCRENDPDPTVPRPTAADPTTPALDRPAPAPRGYTGWVSDLGDLLSSGWENWPVPTTVEHFKRVLNYSISNSPRQSFVLAPTAEYQRWLGTPGERTREQRNRAARRNESLVIMSRILHNYGVDLNPDKLPALLKPYLTPHYPALSYSPFAEWWLDPAIRDVVESPDTWAGMAANITANYLTVGAVLRVGRALLLRVAPLRALTIVTAPVPVAVSSFLGLSGRGRESDLVFERYQRGLTLSPRAWAVHYLLNLFTLGLFTVYLYKLFRYFRDTYDVLHGLRRTEVYTQYQDRQISESPYDDRILGAQVFGLMMAGSLAVSWARGRPTLGTRALLGSVRLTYRALRTTAGGTWYATTWTAHHTAAGARAAAAGVRYTLDLGVYYTVVGSQHATTGAQRVSMVMIRMAEPAGRSMNQLLIAARSGQFLRWPASGLTNLPGALTAAYRLVPSPVAATAFAGTFAFFAVYKARQDSSAAYRARQNMINSQTRRNPGA